MRRAKTSAGISPQQLKHFAIAAVVLTCLLALFASGEDWGARAQVDAVEAKNKLVEEQTERVGTKKLLNSVAVRAPESAAGFGDDAGPGAMGGGGGGGSMDMPAVVPGPRGTGGIAPLPRSGPPVPGTVTTIKGVPSDQAPGTRSKPKNQVQSGAVSTDQAKQIKANARERSGSTEGND